MPHLSVNLRDLREINAAPQRKSARSAGNKAAYGGEQMDVQDRL